MNKRKPPDLEEVFFHSIVEALLETDKSVNKKNLQVEISLITSTVLFLFSLIQA